MRCLACRCRRRTRERCLSSQPAQVGVGGLGGLDADLGVDDLGAVGTGEDGVQVEFGDLRQVIGHLGDPQQHVLQRGEVGGGGAGAPSSNGAPGTDRMR